MSRPGRGVGSTAPARSGWLATVVRLCGRFLEIRAVLLCGSDDLTDDYSDLESFCSPACHFRGAITPGSADWIASPHFAEAPGVAGSGVWGL